MSDTTTRLAISFAVASLGLLIYSFIKRGIEHTQSLGRNREEETIRQDVYRLSDRDHNGLLSESELYDLGMNLGIVNKDSPLTLGELEARIRYAPLSAYESYLEGKQQE